MYYNKKEMVAMLLAGGAGTRLGVLTRDVAKPAVPFGGKYRIIDFTLSNCINSGIDTIGVLTQYQPFELNQYIGNGQPWDLDRVNGGVFVLPPYMRTGNSGEWYKGTANAIYQNINFIKGYNPEYVLILSGDHIYKMDYDKMLDEHKKKNADCTIAVINVSIDEAKRFGIMKTDEEGRITEFFEKPKNPVSTKASMGIYIFNWQRLKEYLIADEEDKTSSNDFGKNIIPNMLADGLNLYAYEFDGYWKDVGTVGSLWQANMDLLDANSGINLSDGAWKIYARNMAEPPQCVHSGAKVVNTLMSEGCVISGEVKHSILSQKVTVEDGAIVEDSILFPGVVVKKGAIVRYSIVDSGVVVGEGARVGEENATLDEIAVIGAHAIIQKDTVIAKGSMVEGRSL
ncbi:MAG: glucose-1-phosphate adenylyltransferase [Clostridia bacterium]|nr:glucose-1-phosphate adenylyltransferase [Clostridia bacterium]